MRIAISSPEPLFLDGLVSLFSEKRYLVVARGTDLRECINAARQEQADLLVVDLAGATESDFQFLLGVQMCAELRTIVIGEGEVLPTGFENSVSRSDSARALLEKVEALVADLAPAPRGRGRPRMMTNGFPLSNREYQVACLIAQGFTNQKIAETLAIKEQNVKNLVTVIIHKLHVENRVQVALRWSASHQSR